MGKGKRIRARHRAEREAAARPTEPDWANDHEQRSRDMAQRAVPLPQIMRCNVCGAEADTSGNIMIGPGSSKVTVTGNRQSCRRPGCPGMAVQMVDGTFDVDRDGVLSIVAAVRPPGITVGDYERAVEIIQRARAAGATDAQAVTQVVEHIPRLARLRAWTEANPAWAALIVAVLLGIPQLAVAGASLINDLTSAPPADAEQPVVAREVPSEPSVRQLCETEAERRGFPLPAAPAAPDEPESRSPEPTD